MGDSVEVRLARIEEKQDGQNATLDRIESRLDEFCDTVNGNPSAKVPGLVMEVDRIKRWIAGAAWILGVVTLAVIGLIVDWVKKKIL